MKRLLLIGLDETEITEIKRQVTDPIVAHEMIPRVKLLNGTFYVERPNWFNTFMPVSHVVFHGIFEVEKDFPLISALALWGGPCLPNARGMMDCRLRLPCLIRALSITRFGSMRRGFADRYTVMSSEEFLVAKWGNWHCGDDKLKFTGDHESQLPTLFEPFIAGEAVRVVLIGDQQWQIRMSGDDWLQSIHHQDAALMPLDNELLEDTLRLRDHFGLEVMAVDYMLGEDGQKHLLEVNHIPNVTRFPEIRNAYLTYVSTWFNHG